MKLELGGGDLQRGGEWVNVDIVETADIRHDLDVMPWPFADESIGEVYSSHCIEHVNCPIAFLCEVARICKVGADVEIRCPDANSEMAMVRGHKSVVSVNFMRHASDVFPDRIWTGERMLKLQRYEPHGDDFWLPMAMLDWPDKSEEWIMRWIPRTCHENRFFFRVEKRDGR